jgi:hypothetical protein
MRLLKPVCNPGTPASAVVSLTMRRVVCSPVITVDHACFRLSFSLVALKGFDTTFDLIERIMEFIRLRFDNALDGRLQVR